MLLILFGCLWVVSVGLTVVVCTRLALLLMFDLIVLWLWVCLFCCFVFAICLLSFVV